MSQSIQSVGPLLFLCGLRPEGAIAIYVKFHVQ